MAATAFQLDAAFLAEALNVARTGICFVDDAGRFIEVNPAFCELTGFSREELIGRPWTIAAPAEIERRADRFLRAVFADSPNIPSQWKIQRKGGEQVEVLASFRPLTRSDGQRYAVLTIADLTARITKHTEVVRRHRDVLLELAALDKSDRRSALDRILAVDAETLGAERVSYWSIVGGGASIQCEASHTRALRGPDPAYVGKLLRAADYPTYFAAVVANRPVVANRAQTDPATREFSEGYLVPAGITSMLDVPVWFQGTVVGVICHVHVGPPRDWTTEEVDFASSIASMASIALEAARRRELLDALQKSEEKYRRVVENANEAIVVAQDGYIRYANPQCSRLTGYPAEDLLAKPFLDFVHPEDRAMVREHHAKRMRGEASETSYEFRILDREGRLRWLHISAVALDWEGRTASLNFLTDVTAVRELQDHLQRSLAEREVILRSALVGISFAANRRHLWVNDTFARMVGYEKEELIGQPSLIHFADRASWEAFGAEAYSVLASGKPYTTERLFKRKDGSLFWCQVAGNAVDPGDLTRGSIWTNIDITERKRAEEEIRRALEKERELNELKSRFVAMTSHEFRTPLATIQSSAELLERYGERLPAEEKRELNQRIRAAVERMTGMLDNVLTIGKAEASMLAFEPAPTDLAHFCQTLADEMRMMASARHTLEYAYEGGRGPVNVDGKLLRHVLANLLSNAFKYSPDGGRVLFRARIDGREAVFEVTDEGIGIPPEDQPQLFATFQRARNVGNIAGTGLGLAIVKKSLELHGGAIRFDSAPGRGARFCVTIPLGN